MVNILFLRNCFETLKLFNKTHLATKCSFELASHPLCGSLTCVGSSFLPGAQAGFSFVAYDSKKRFNLAQNGYFSPQAAILKQLHSKVLINQMRNHFLLTYLLICMLTVTLKAQQPDSSWQKAPAPLPLAFLTDYELQLSEQDGKDQLLFISNIGDARARVSFNNNEPTELRFTDGRAQHALDVDESGRLLLIRSGEPSDAQLRIYHLSQASNGPYRVRKIPLWMSIIPPLVAIGLALLFKEVIISLFIGIWAGAFIASGLRFDTLLYSFWAVIDKYIINALNDSGHLSVIVFSLLIGGMVAVISRNGGMAGVVQSLSKYARSARSSQFITWLLGIAIFFDDYANTLIVGNTMRSVTDRFRISREKLAYIVDSTAAPVSAIAFITTWIGAELGYIEGGIDTLSNFDSGLSPYSIFISSLKYSFYPVLTLCFILILVYTGRDFGSMYKAELRARSTGQVSPAATASEDEPNMEDLTPVAGAPLRWYNAVIPVVTVILMTMYGLVDTGMASLYSDLVGNNIAVASSSWGDVWGAMNAVVEAEQPGFFMKMGELIGRSDSYTALLWASMSGLVIAILLTLAGRIMKLFDSMHTMTTGFKTMLPALIILTLAWALAITTQELHTADYLTLLLQDSVSPFAIPAIIFILAAAIAFSTGSSWSTMAILYPIAIPTVWAVSQSQGVDSATSMELLLNVIATVLAASVLGDHCSPISDTTILSSLASDCNHIDHVRTQLPYALTVGVVSLLAGTIATLLGGGWLISMVLMLFSLTALFLIVLKLGKKID